MNDLKLNITPESQTITFTRTFNAPAELVFRMFTDADHMAKWNGPKDTTTIIDTLEARTGGQWRYRNRGADGVDYAFRGVFHEIIPGKRIVQTFEFEGMSGDFEGMPSHVMLEAIQFEALPDGKTRIHGSSTFQTLEDRDGMMNNGMEHGMIECYERMDTLLAALQTA